jgi:hypothetical protein
MFGSTEPSSLVRESGIFEPGIWQRPQAKESEPLIKVSNLIFSKVFTTALQTLKAKTRTRSVKADN